MSTNNSLIDVLPIRGGDERVGNAQRASSTAQFTRRDLLHRVGNFALVFSFADLLAGCSKPSDPEAEIRAFIERMTGAVTTGDMATLRDGLANDYSDQDSNNKAGCLGMVQIILRRTQSPQVTSRIKTVEIASADEATVLLVAGLASGPITDSNTRSGIYRFRLILRRNDDEQWQIRRVTWEQTTALDLLSPD